MGLAGFPAFLGGSDPSRGFGPALSVSWPLDAFGGVFSGCGCPLWSSTLVAAGAADGFLPHLRGKRHLDLGCLRHLMKILVWENPVQTSCSGAPKACPEKVCVKPRGKSDTTCNLVARPSAATAGRARLRVVAVGGHAGRRAAPVAKRQAWPHGAP